MSTSNQTKGDPTYHLHLREAGLIALVFVIQAAVICWFIWDGFYQASADQVLSALVFGLPSWFVVGVFLPSVLGIFALAFLVRKYFSE